MDKGTPPMPSKSQRRNDRIDYDSARKLLEEEFGSIERGAPLKEPNEAERKHFDGVFESSTQAYREGFLGCILARISDRNIDITKPYISQGADAYNGRTLDERVVNPFLSEKRIPASRAPFLSALRRSVRFDESTLKGLRDKEGWNSLLALIASLRALKDEADLKNLLRYTLFRFVELRTASVIPLVKLQRMSLEQYGRLIEGLLKTPSGGRFPTMLAASTFFSLKKVFGLDWKIEVQGINVSDKSSNAGGDIMVKHRGKTLLAAEVTERPVNKTRVVSIFQAKIAPQGIDDYLFLVAGNADEEVMKQARRYFSQGHEINFFDMKNWILVILATIGKSGREIFNRELVGMLEEQDVPASMKVAWNKQIETITAV